jgi:5-methylcytosine-specific restriction endonuclease McrA
MAISEEQRERNKEYDRAHNIRYYQANKERILAYKHANREKIAEAQKAYYQANREKVLAYKKAYAQANKEKLTAYREANKEKMDAYNKEYYQVNKEKLAEYREANKERNTAYARDYCQANPGKINAHTSKRRAAKIQRTPNWLTLDDYHAIRSLYETAAALTKSTGIKHHVDHVIPLQGKTVSGFHCPTNLQILTQSENCSKHNKFTGDE